MSASTHLLEPSTSTIHLRRAPPAVRHAPRGSTRSTRTSSSSTQHRTRTHHSYSSTTSSASPYQKTCTSIPRHFSELARRPSKAIRGPIPLLRLVGVLWATAKKGCACASYASPSAARVSGSKSVHVYTGLLDGALPLVSLSRTDAEVDIATFEGHYLKVPPQVRSTCFPTMRA